MFPAFIFQIHNRCAPSVKAECTLGEFANMIISPTAICPAVLDRQRSVNVANSKNKVTIIIRSPAPINFP